MLERGDIFWHGLSDSLYRLAGLSPRAPTQLPEAIIQRKFVLTRVMLQQTALVAIEIGRLLVCVRLLLLMTSLALRMSFLRYRVNE